MKTSKKMKADSAIPAGYVVELQTCEGQVLVSCPDIPGMHSVGDDQADALREAVDGLETILAAIMQDREPIPKAKAVANGRDRHFVYLPTIAMAKIALYQAMLAQGVAKAELARRLHVPRVSIDRLLDIRHNSRMDQLDAAMESVGQRISGLLVKAA
jgi:antitoxin HicB